MMSREPAQITVNVCAARNLQAKKKGETCHASVVFGIGKQQFVTETIESNSPEWNQEAVLNLSSKDHNQMIKFKVRDNAHVLGVVMMSVNSLPGERRSKPKWEFLAPYKKAGEVSGELQIECFVSEYRPGQVVSNSEKSSPLQSRFGSQEDILDASKKGRFSSHRRTPSSGRPNSGSFPLSVRLPEGEGSSTSVEAAIAVSSKKESDLSDLKLAKSVRSSPIVPRPTSNTSLGVSSAGESMLMGSSRGHSPATTSMEVLTCPSVTGVSPREGPMEGGQKVVLRGSNLGLCREDVLKVVVVDVDCTKTLEYVSPAKLIIVTSSRYAPAVGPVKVETRSGGVGVSSVNFTFVEKAIASPPEVSGISPSTCRIEGGERVVLRGNNLGECKEDIVRVVLAGVDCTETLEFFSPSKLAVTTRPRSSAGEGEVLVETARGGISQSSMVFTYTEDVITISNHAKTMEALKKQQEERHQVEVKSLKSQIKDLKDDNSKLRERNQALKQYIDQLLLAVIDVRPDLLEVKPSRSLTSHSTTPSVASVASNF